MKPAITNSTDSVSRSGRRGPRAGLHRTTLQAINQELALAALASGAGPAIHRPIHVAIQVASGCNLECVMCLEHVRPVEDRRGRNLKSLPMELFQRLEREVFPFSSRLTFGIGGEPTFAENFETFLRRGFETGQEIELITNATRFSVGTLAETIADCVSYLQISIDGATEATYERIRVGSKLSHVLANLERLNRRREQHPPGERTHVSFWVTLMRSNVRELPQLIDLAKKYAIDRVHAQHATPITPEAAADSLLDDPALWNEVRQQTIEHARRCGMEIDLPPALPIASRADPITVAVGSAGPAAGIGTQTEASASAGSLPQPIDPREEIRKLDLRYSRLLDHAIPCHLPATAIYMLWDGRVVPCCYPYAQEKMCMGNLAEAEFATIWNGERYRALRRGMKVGVGLAVCRHCPVVHDVPITLAAEAEMRNSPTLEEWLRSRPEGVSDIGEFPTGLIESLATGPVVRELDTLRRHALALESERERMREHISNLEQERAAANAAAQRPVVSRIASYLLRRIRH